MTFKIEFNNKVYTDQYIKDANIDEIIILLKELNLSYSQYKDFLFNRELLENKVLELLNKKGRLIKDEEIFLKESSEIELATTLVEQSIDYISFTEEKSETYNFISNKNIIEGEYFNMTENLIENNFNLQDDIFIYINSGSIILKKEGSKSLLTLPLSIVVSDIESPDNFQLEILDLILKNEIKKSSSYIINDIENLLCNKNSTIILDDNENHITISKDTFIYKLLDALKAFFQLKHIIYKNLIIAFNEYNMIKILMKEKDNNLLTSNLNVINILALNLYKDNLEINKYKDNLLFLDMNKTLILKSHCEIEEGEFCYSAKGEGHVVSKNLNISVEALSNLIMKYGYYKSLNLNIKNEYINFITTEDMFRELDNLENFNVNIDFFDSKNINLNLKETIKNYYSNLNTIIMFLQDSGKKDLKLKYDLKDNNVEITLSYYEINKLLSLVLYNSLKDDLKNIEGKISLVAPIKIVKPLREILKEFIPGKLVTGISIDKMMNYIENGYKNVCKGIIDHTFNLYDKEADISLVTLDFKGDIIEVLNNDKKVNSLFKSIKTSNLDFTLRVGGIVENLTIYLNDFIPLDKTLKEELSKKINMSIDNNCINSNKIYASLDESKLTLTVFSIQNKDNAEFISDIIIKEF